MSKQKQADDREPLLTPYNDQDYEAAQANGYGSDSEAGPSNYGAAEAGGVLYASAANDSRRRRHNRITTRDAWVEFFTKGLLALAVVVFVSAGVLKFMRLDDLQQELARVPNIAIEDFFVEGFSERGVDVRVVGTNRIDYSVVDGTIRRGVVSGVAKVLDSLTLSDSKLQIYFEQDAGAYARAVDATMPDMKVSTAQNSTTEFDFVTTLSDFGSAHVMASIVKQLLSSDPLTFRGIADIGIRKGHLHFGQVPIVVEQTLNSQDGEMALTLGAVQLSNHQTGVKVSTLVSADYNYPIKADIPKLEWDLKIPGCNNEVYVSTGDTSAIHLEPYSQANVTVEATLDTVPETLIQACGPGQKSPLDMFISKYLGGSENIITIQGSRQQQAVPDWMSGILKHFRFQYKLPGKTSSDDLIKDLRFDDFKLAIPDNKNARVSAAVRVTVSPPQAINIDKKVPLEVKNARGVADLFSKGTKFGQVVIDEWVNCTTSLVNGDYIVEFLLDNVPVNVTDQGLFSRIVQAILFRGSAPVRVESLVDAKIHLPVGEFVLSEIPASGDTELRRN